MDHLLAELIFSPAESIDGHYRLAAASLRRWHNPLTHACENGAIRTTGTCLWVDTANHSALIASGAMFMNQ